MSSQTYRDGEAGSHSVQVVRVVAHGHNLGDDGLACPLHAKYFSQFLQVVRSSLADGKDCVTKPSHAQVAELFVKELDAELAGQQGNILDDGETHSPLLVLCQVDDGWQQ